MKSFLDSDDNTRLAQLERNLGHSVMKEVTFNIRTKTKIKLLSGLMAIKEWLSQNEETLALLNNRNSINIDTIITRFLLFIKGLEYQNFDNCHIDGQYWEWFVVHCAKEGIYLIIDKTKVIQQKKLDIIIKRNKKELQDKVRNSHIPIDVSTPEELYSFLKEGGE